MYRMNRPLGDALIQDNPPSNAAPASFCSIRPGMCVTAAMKAKAAAKCPPLPRVKGYSTRGLGVDSSSKVCSSYSTIFTDWQLGVWNPCEVKNLPTCPPTKATPPQVQTFDEPTPPQEEEEDDNNMYVIGGIVAVLVAGGIGYAVFRKKKKGKKK